MDPLAPTISAALRALRNRCPLIDKHSYPGYKEVPSNADPGAIFSTTTVPVDLRNAKPTFSVGVRLTMVEEMMVGIMNGSRPFSGLDNFSDGSDFSSEVDGMEDSDGSGWDVLVVDRWRPSDIG